MLPRIRRRRRQTPRDPARQFIPPAAQPAPNAVLVTARVLPLSLALPSSVVVIIVPAAPGVAVVAPLLVVAFLVEQLLQARMFLGLLTASMRIIF